MSDLGPKPELVWLPVAALLVDPKYQRDTGSRRSKTVIEKIARAFKWSRFGVVAVVRHRCGWHVIDGQHRVEACRLRGDVPKVPAVVLPHASVAEAAADFVAINRDRVAVTPLHVHHAELAARDPEALAIDKVCRELGIEICRYPVPSSVIKPRQTLAVGTIRSILLKGGPAFLTDVFRRVLATGGDKAGGFTAAALRNAAKELGAVSANAAPDAAPARRAARSRKCLGCGLVFASEGIHNRVCPRCKVRS